MNRRIALVTIVVSDYDEAIAFYTEKLGFILLEDSVMSETKRWVVVAPGKGEGTALLLARAVGPEQESSVGNQTGGRVALFLHTDDFWRDHAAFTEKGVHFLRGPVEETYGTVAVFKDLYGTQWDLIGPAAGGENS